MLNCLFNCNRIKKTIIALHYHVLEMNTAVSKKEVVSIRDIAREAQVSVSTVSLVLNERADELRIKPSTRQKVLEAAKKLNYRPNLAARKLRQENPQSAPVIVLFWSSNTTGLIIERLINGIEKFRSSYNMDFNLVIQPYNTNDLHKFEYILRSTSMFDGLLITGTSLKDFEFLHGIDVKLPVVLAGRDSEKYSCCIENEYESGYKVAELFYNKGHKDVGIIGPEIKYFATSLRRQGFLDGCRDNNIQLKQENIITCKYSVEDGCRSVREIIKRGNIPTALFFTPEILAIGGLKVFHEHGISIPSDIEIVSYGDTMMANYTIPSLTTVRSPLEDMACESMKMLLDMINKRLEPPVKSFFETIFVFRQSCGEFQI